MPVHCRPGITTENVPRFRQRALAFVFVLNLVAASLVAATATVEVHLATSDPSVPVAGSLVLRAAGTASPRIVGASSGKIPIQGEAGSTWRVSLRDPNWWMPETTVVLPPNGIAQRTIRLWRAGLLTGKYQVPAGVKFDASTLRLTIESPPQPTTTPLISADTELTCSSGPDFTFSCTGPATAVDLALRLKPFVPRYWWGISLTPRTTTNLGEVILRRGASVSAFIDAKQLPPGTTARARLFRMTAQVPSATTARLNVPVAEQSFDRRGFVQLSPVAPGKYVLEAGADGYAPARVFPVDVYEERESTLKRLIVLQRPLDVRIAVTPPLDPYDKPWFVELERANDYGSGYDPLPATRKRVNDAGVVTVSNQAPGHFRLTAIDSRENQVAYEEVDVRDTADTHVQISVASSRVTGRLTIGKRPLEASLWFGGEHGAQRIAMTSDGHGRFAGYLPRRGRWNVEVRNRAASIETSTVVDVPTDGKQLSIELPDTTVSGSVLGPDGPVAGADVAALTTAGTVSMMSGGDGSFTMKGLPAADVTLRAHERSTGNVSRAVVLHLAATREMSDVQLVLESTKKIQGYVLAHGAPVVGASVSAFAPEAGHGEEMRGVTDLAGKFELSITPRARHALFVPIAPGQALRVFDVAFTDAPVSLNVDEVGGTLHLSVPTAPTNVMLFQNGLPLPLGLAASWAAGHGERLSDPQHLTVPAVAAGQYRLCGASGCVEGQLGPYGELTLTLSAKR